MARQERDEVAERRERILAALAARPGERVSGGALARELGCSRAAVHRHVDALRAAGVPIDATRAGYVLDPAAAGVMQPPPPSPLRARQDSNLRPSD